MPSFKFNIALLALFHYHLGFDMHLEVVVGLTASFRIWHAFRSSVGVHNYILAMLAMRVLYPLNLVFFFVRCIFFFGISCWSSKNNSIQRLLSTLFVRSFFFCNVSLSHFLLWCCSFLFVFDSLWCSFILYFRVVLI